MSPLKLVIACDHTGIEQAKSLKQYLTDLGYEIKYLGPETLNKDDDYPDFIKPAALAVASGEYGIGIILGGSGQGEAMSANRVKGVRCGVYYGPAVPKGVVDVSGRESRDPYEILKLTKKHNHANMLSLGVRFLTLEDIKQACRVWLESKYEDEPRHLRRISKLDGAES
jgi:ribose 5-phosphate isomerase B